MDSLHSVQILDEDGHWVDILSPPARLAGRSADIVASKGGRAGLSTASSGEKVRNDYSRKAQLVIATAVALMHGVVISALWHIHGHKSTSLPEETAPPIIAYIIERDRTTESLTLPGEHWTMPDIQITDLPLLKLAADDVDTRPGIIGDISVPRPYVAGNTELRRFARQAGLTTGQAQTVVLGVTVQADGSVGDVTVLVSSGQPLVDEAAIAYARSLHWIPGTRRREAVPMRVRFPVTLAGPARPPPPTTEGAKAYSQGPGLFGNPARKHGSAAFGGL